MNWLIIVVVLLVAVGPVLYLLPSASDKRLSALRMQARKAGLNVKITHLPKLNPESHERVSAGGKTLETRVSCVAYQLPLGGSVRDVSDLVLLRIPDQPTVPVREVIPGWSLHPQSDQASWQQFAGDAATLEDLQSALAAFPQDALGCGLNDRFVTCYWREKAKPESDAVAAIVKALTPLQQDLRRRFGKSGVVSGPTHDG